MSFLQILFRLIIRWRGVLLVAISVYCFSVTASADKLCEILLWLLKLSLFYVDVRGSRRSSLFNYLVFSIGYFFVTCTFVLRPSMNFKNRHLHLEKTRIPLNAMSSSQTSKRIVSNVMRDKERNKKREKEIRKWNSLLYWFYKRNLLLALHTCLLKTCRGVSPVYLLLTA